MRQFIQGSDSAFSMLERRSRQSCVVFQNEELPPGAMPERARIGFEVSPDDDSATLLVDRGIQYHGSLTTVGVWLRNGAYRFPSFAELRAWIQGDLARCFGIPENDVSSVRDLGRIVVSTPNQLTDLAAVRRNLPDPAEPFFVNEQDLFNELRKQVCGQDPALRTLSRRVSRHLARRQPLRPATLFAVGPTGTGKTKTAETLAPALRSLRSDESVYAYLRLDMSEYQERHRISQLLGAPQGYIGYGDGAQLVDVLAANPKTVVLFDEIEKAHPDVFRTLLNAMDAGRLSTASRTSGGRSIDCRQAIFMFTSNVDCAEILGDLEKAKAFDEQREVDRVCRRRLLASNLSPELIGRIGAFLVFCPLTLETRAEIVAQSISRTAVEYGLEVQQIEPSVIVAILRQSRGADFGARPDEYVVDDLLGEAFAKAAASKSAPQVCVTGGPPFHCQSLDDAPMT